MSTPVAPLYLEFIQSSPDLVAPRTLNASIGGGKPVELVVDTGSLGIAIGTKFLGENYRPLLPLPPAPISYSSSGNSYRGQWVLTTVEITGMHGRGFTTSKEIAVFAVDGSDVSMMGVATRFPDPCLLQNPFLNVPGMSSGLMRYGYILTAQGVTFGYDEAEVASFPIRVPIDPIFGSPLPNATITLTPADTSLGSYTFTAPFLLDTGLDYLIAAPPSREPAPPAPYQKPSREPRVTQDDIFIPEMQVTLALEGADKTSQTIWSFNTSDCPIYSRVVNAALPHYGRFAVPSPGGFLNSGRHLLGAYDYLVDLQDLVMGLRTPATRS
jgi:hypothetical protein